MPNPILSQPSQESNKRPLDKEVYLDAQSKGFASRIVKYHQDNASRSRNTYKSPGDLPIVHLKRSNDLLFKNRRSSSLSNLRVGRLDRNYGTEEATRRQPAGMSLQRGLSTYDDHYSSPVHQHQPMAPTPLSSDAYNGPRSVLDELKEISRKRINNNHFDEKLELNQEPKKYCRDVSDVDGPSGSGTSSMQMQQMQIHNQKRQRNVSPPISGGQTAGGSSGAVVQQRVKKVCRDSYDVISSLSSSIGLSRSKSTIPTSYSPLSSGLVASPSSSNVNNSRPADSLRPSKTGLASLTQGGSGAPLPTVLVPVNKRTPNTDQSTPVLPRDALRSTVSVPVLPKQIIVPTKEAPKLTLFNKDYKTIITNNNQKRKKESDSGSSDDDYDEESYGRNPFVKPQESTSPTLVTGVEEKRKVEKNKLAMMLKCLAGDFEDSDEEEEKAKDVVDVAKGSNTNPAPVTSTGISFTGPKTTTDTGIKTNVLNLPTAIASGETTKPQTITVSASEQTASTIKPTVDPQPSIAQPPVEDNVAKLKDPVAATSTALPINPITSETNKTGFNAPTAAMFTFNKTTTTTSAPAIELSSSNTTTTTASPGFKFGAAIPSLSGVTPITTTTSNAPTLIAPVSSAPVATKSAIPGIFSFPKSPSQASTGSTTTTSTTVTPSSLPTFGSAISSLGATTTFGPKQPEPSKIPVPTGTFSFGSSTTTTTNNNPMPTPIQSAFTAPANPSTNLNSTFAFGSTPSKDPTPALLPAASSIPKPQATFSFGGGSTAAPVPTSAPPATSNVPSMFSFGGSGTAAPTATKPATTTFGFNAPGNTVAPNANPFGGAPPATQSATTTTASSVFGGGMSNTSNAFSFGDSSNSSQTATAIKAPVFGGMTQTAGNNNAASSTFSFGGGSTTTAAPSPFGGTSSTNKSSIPVFGGMGQSTNQNSAPPAFGAPKSNVTTFGGGGLGSNTSAPVFGGGAAATQAPAGNTSSPFSFGGGSSAPTPAAAPAATNSPFAFGGGASKPAETKNANSTFSFGGAANLNSSSTGIMGNNSNSNTSSVGSPFAFGGGGGQSTQQQQGQQSNSVFGGGMGTSATPIFGAATNTATAASPFGDNKANSTFSFGGGSNNTSNTTGAGQQSLQSSASAFNFSSSSTGSVGGGNAFKFGDSAPQPQQQQQLNQSSSFAFGQNNNNNQAGAGMFNFGAQGDPNASAGGAGGAPAFNIGTGGGPPRRPIRQATRRLK